MCIASLFFVLNNIHYFLKIKIFKLDLFLKIKINNFVIKKIIIY
jgi:hypothetical protein